MVTAIKQRVKIERDGIVEIRDNGLFVGDEAEVILLLEDDAEGEMQALVRAYDEAKAEQDMEGTAAVEFGVALMEINTRSKPEGGC